MAEVVLLYTDCVACAAHEGARASDSPAAAAEEAALILCRMLDRGNVPERIVVDLCPRHRDIVRGPRRSP